MLMWALRLGAVLAIVAGTQITEKALDVTAADDGLAVFFIVCVAVSLAVFIAVQLALGLCMAVADIARDG